MYIYTQSHLKDVCLYFSPKLKEIFSRNFNPTNIRQLVSHLTGSNSYADLCNKLKHQPVKIGLNGEMAQAPFHFLVTKHKITATEDQMKQLVSLSESQSLQLLYAPGDSFTSSISEDDCYGPETNEPLIQLKKNAIEFGKLQITHKVNGTYPDMDDDLNSGAYVDCDYDMNTFLDYYIQENEDIEFEAGIYQSSLSRKEINKHLDNGIKKWREENKCKVNDMTAHALNKTASIRYSYLLSEGCVIESSTIGINEVNNDAKSVLLQHFSKECTLVYWRTVKPDSEFLLGEENLRGSFVGTQAIYLGVLDKGEFTPIGSASALLLTFQYSNELCVFDICDAHSSCMNDIFKEIDKHIRQSGSSWEDFITTNTNNYTSSVTRIWGKENIYNEKGIDVLMARIFTTSFFPICDDYFDEDEFTDKTSAPMVNSSCIVFSEVCGSQKVDETDSVFNIFSLDEYSDDERPPMTSKEINARKKQMDFAKKLHDELVREHAKVITYDPLAHPIN
jgi:hypothetical protein